MDELQPIGPTRCYVVVCRDGRIDVDAARNFLTGPRPDSHYHPITRPDHEGAPRGETHRQVSPSASEGLDLPLGEGSPEDHQRVQFADECVGAIDSVAFAHSRAGETLRGGNFAVANQEG
jgi:hypothetical protein